MSSRADEPTHGARLGRYRVQEKLGGGGMGAVYRAIDQRTGQVVALKRMHAERDNSERYAADVLRFRREFHTLASLRHPRIVRVFDYGLDDEGPYYTMELLGGRDLRDLFRDEGPMPPEQACSLMRDVASALALLHARGLVHRDLSPRNVRVIDGRAVLFDFGVLVNAGAVTDVAGTVAFIAPEMIRGLPIDGRADLFALGVLGYGMLTGLRPFVARDFDDLERAWREPLRPPSSFSPVPEALEDLVLDLLCLEPLGRPASAAVLVGKLTALGGLAPDPELEIDPGYVSSASIVGREKEIALLSALLAETRDGGSRAFVVEAESGAGKSRLVQELLLQAKLDGILALHIACEQQTGGPYGVIAHLIDEAFAAAPEQAHDAAADDAELLGRLFAPVRKRFRSTVTPGPPAEPAEERMRSQKAVTGFFRALATLKPVLLLVDDVQRCDEASAAVLASLAYAGVPGLIVGAALRKGEAARAPTAIASLRSVRPFLTLAGLDVDGVQALLRSIFGEVANLSRLARALHEATAGSPLWCTELTRQMIERRAVRHVDGAWIVPDDIALEHASTGLADAMRARVGQLPEQARALGALLAMVGGEVSLERVFALANGADGSLASEDRAQMVFGALARLQEEGVLVELGGVFRLRHDALRDALLFGLPAERRVALHRHIGEVLLAAAKQRADADAEDEAQIGWHLLRGGDEARGAPMLERAGRRLFAALALADCIAPLEAALSARIRAGAPLAVRAELGAILVAAGWVSDREVGTRHAELAVAGLGTLSGATDAVRFGRVIGSHLGFALGFALAWLRWALRSGEARGLDPSKALVLFGQTLTFACALTYSANQKARVTALVGRADFFRAFRGFTPFAGYLALHAMTDILDGRLALAEERLEGARVLATKSRLNPLSEAERRQADAGLRSMKGLVYVNQFSPGLEHELTRIDEIGLEYYRLTGVTTRIVRYRYRGEETKARALEAASEASSLALGSWSTDLQRLLFAHPAYAFCHDIEGLARSLDALERRVEEGMEFATRVDITRAELLRERGDHGAAIAILERTRGTLDAEDVLFRQHVGCALAQCQLEAYRYEEAERCARDTLAIGDDPVVRIMLPWLRARRTLALALDGLGRGEDAVQLLDATIPIAEELDCPVFAGELHEARARVAFAAGDRVGFELHRARCGEWLRPTENPGLVAVVERLADLERDRDSVPADARRRRPGRENSASRSERSRPVAVESAGNDAATIANPRSARPSHAADESETAEAVERTRDRD